MRVLHAVGAGETFVARGVYQHSEQAVTQAWTWHALGDEARFLRVDHDEHAVTGMSRLSDVLIDAGGRVERLNVQVWQTHAAAPYRQLRLEYVFLDGYVQVMRKVNAAAHEHLEVALPDDYVVRLLDVYLMWGETLARPYDPQLAVFVPLWKHEGAVGQVVRGALPQVVAAEADTWTLQGQPVAATRYTTKTDRVIWVDAHGVPLCLRHTRLDEEVRLTNYAHR